MYKYNSEKPQPKRSMDGFLSSTPRRPKYQTVPVKASKNERMESISNPRNNKLDDFDKSEGFRSNGTPTINNAGGVESSKIRINSPIPKRSKVGFSGRTNSKRKKGNKKKIVFRIFAFTSVLVLLLTGWVFGKAWWNAHKALKGGGQSAALNKEVDPNSLNGEGDGRVNVLLMGKGGAAEANDGGELTDSMMVASIDPVNNGVVLVSIPRDLWVKPDGLWPMKINAVYSSAKDQALYKNPKDKDAAEKAGISAAETTVQQYLGVKVNYYGMIDFSAFQEAVDAIGGIDVTLAEPYSDPTMYIGKKMLSLPAGTSHLDGGTALGYARSRHGADRGDFDRGEHQQKVIVGIKDKVLSLGTFSNPVKVSGLLDTFGNRVQTNFAMNDMMRLYDLSKKIQSGNITNVDLAMQGEEVVTTGMIGDQSVVYPKAGVSDYSEVKSYIRSKIIDGYILKEKPTITVLNATGKPGAAKKRADELKSYGYNVLQVADAPNSNLTSTTLVDKTGGAKKYTKRYLELRFNTKAVKDISGMDLTPYTSDYVVVIGPNG